VKEKFALFSLRNQDLSLFPTFTSDLFFFVLVNNNNNVNDSSRITRYINYLLYDDAVIDRFDEGRIDPLLDFS
jgi:hypothetical protein